MTPRKRQLEADLEDVYEAHRISERRVRQLEAELYDCQEALHRAAAVMNGLQEGFAALAAHAARAADLAEEPPHVAGVTPILPGMAEEARICDECGIVGGHRSGCSSWIGSAG